MTRSPRQRARLPRGEVAQRFRNRILHGESVLFPEDVGASVLDELIGPADAFDLGFETRIIEMLDHRAAEAVADGVVLEGHHERTLCRVFLEAGGIERLDPARIDEGAHMGHGSFVT